MEANSIYQWNITEVNTAMTITTGTISINIPTLMRPTMMHYKLHFLCMAHPCPYDRQSSHVTFTATAISSNPSNDADLMGSSI